MQKFTHWNLQLKNSKKIYLVRSGIFNNLNKKLLAKTAIFDKTLAVWELSDLVTLNLHIRILVLTLLTNAT